MISILPLVRCISIGHLIPFLFGIFHHEVLCFFNLESLEGHIMADQDVFADGASINNPDVGDLGRFDHLVATQCRQALDILNEAGGVRPVTLRDFLSSLEKSMMVLSVS